MSTMAPKPLKLEHISLRIDGEVAHIELNRPPVNAINSGVLMELRSIANELTRLGTVKVALLKGAGKHFCAGADIKEIQSLEPGDAVSDFSSLGNEAFLAIERSGTYFIALIRGFCLGGGCELAMACHLRVAEDSAVFGQPEVKLGITPGFGATQRLPRLVGRSRAIYMLTTGDQVNATQAAAWGLADIVVPAGGELEAAGERLAKSISGYSKVTLDAIGALVGLGPDVDLEQGLESESETFGRLSQTRDMREGFDAFIAKRKPEFRNS